MMKGLKKSHMPRGKNPVTISHLKRLCEAAAKLPSKFEAARFRSVITLAFFGFLRPSEICSSPAGHQLKVGSVRLAQKGRVCYINFKSFKHSSTTKVVKIEDCVDLNVRPVALLRRYMRLLRNPDRGAPLYDLSPRRFQESLKELCGLAHIKTRVTPHCFRHGGATWASQQGWSETRIKAHGRWRSNAHSHYIKPY